MFFILFPLHIRYERLCDRPKALTRLPNVRDELLSGF